MIDYYSRVMEVLKDSIESIPIDVYEKVIDECVETIDAGGKIIASGLGKNVPICEKFVGTLNSLGIDARFLHTNTAVHGDLGMVGKNDIVFLLSKGGNTYETVALAEYLKQRGTNTWLFSFYENCKTAEIISKKLILNLIQKNLNSLPTKRKCFPAMLTKKKIYLRLLPEMKKIPRQLLQKILR